MDESRLQTVFPLNSRVSLERRCESVVEGVQETVTIARHGQTIPSSPLSDRLVLATKHRAQKVAGCGVGRDFHFYDLPTVTTGFIGFYFDIREVLKVLKVATPDGRFGLCR